MRSSTTDVRHGSRARCSRRRRRPMWSPVCASRATRLGRDRPFGWPLVGCVEPARRRPPDRPRGAAADGDHGARRGERQPVDPWRSRVRPVHPIAGLPLPGRALPERRSGRLPPPGRPGVEQPTLGVGVRERARGRRGDRRRRVGPRQCRLPSRPVLGRPGRRSRLLRSRHSLPPRIVRPPAGVRADRLRAADRPFRRRDALGARGAADPRSTRRTGHRGHPHPSRRCRRRRGPDDDHAGHRSVRLAGRGRPPDAAAAGVPGSRRRVHA